MAQGGAVVASLRVPDAAMRRLTDREAYEIQQYDKIVRFRDAVLSGAHPTIKPIASLLAQPPPGPASTAVQASPGNGASQDNSQLSWPADAGSRDAAHAKAKSAASASLALPGFSLEIPDEHGRAQLLLQRQRLDRALRDEVEQRRLSKASPPDHPSELDVSDVLARALAMAPAPAPAAPSPDGEGLTANHDAASDSFDEKTFYSSRHDNPQSQMLSRVRNDSPPEPQASQATRQQLGLASATAGEGPNRPYGAVAAPEPPIPVPAPQDDSQRDSFANPPVTVPLASIVPGLNNYVGAYHVATPPSQNTASGVQSQSEDSANLGPGQARPEAAPSQTHVLRDSYADLYPPSPLIRGHALQPVAPQPALISPLAAPGQGQEAPSHAVPRTRGTPAQVAALRQEPAAATSPESSPQGGRASDKKRGKKKRKADRQAPEVEASAYIKVELRSPSPLAAPSYVRANKRQRQSRGRVVDLDYEPSYEAPLVHGPDGQYLTRQSRDDPVPLGYDSARAYPSRAASTALVGDPRYGREYLEERRLPAEGHVRGYGVPGPAPAYPYSPGMAYPPRSASHVFSRDGYREPSRSFREYAEGGRVSIRPEGDAYMGPPKTAQPRMLVDTFGREYYDPSHPAVHRPLTPSVRPEDAGLVYERLPPRAVSRHPGLEPYGEGGVVYGGAPAAYAMPRRIVPQSAEYAPYDFRDGPHREYQPRLVGPPGSFMEVEGLADRRPVNEATRGHAPRAASMMPMEAVRYEVPRAYGRMENVRPEVPAPHYTSGVHAEGRREVTQPYMRDFAPRPMEPLHRPQTRAADDIAFIERPRGATQEIVYADDARREVYR